MSNWRKIGATHNFIDIDRVVAVTESNNPEASMVYLDTGLVLEVRMIPPVVGKWVQIWKEKTA